MCFHTKQSKDAQTLAKRFKATFVEQASYVPVSDVNGFSYPKTPVITSTDKDNIQLFYWGLLPHWANDTSLRKHTLNARIETLAEKPSFRDATQNRCLVLIDGFYEWQWLDEKGKKKQKYLITSPDETPFALAGIWSTWTDKQTGQTLNTYAILTTEANEQMSVIHNSKKRMPFILTTNEEALWLDNQPVVPERNLILKTTKVI